jgi:hypothetical protein
MILPTWKHTATLWKKDNVENEYGETYEDYFQIEAFKCHLSRSKAEPMLLSNGEYLTKDKFSLFCDNAIDINKGDIIKCLSYTFIAAEPFHYGISQTVELITNDNNY